MLGVCCPAQGLFMFTPSLFLSMPHKQLIVGPFFAFDQGGGKRKASGPHDEKSEAGSLGTHPPPTHLPTRSNAAY
jgi:hypothetical protein